MINTNPTTRRPVPFTPIGRGVGLLEKRVRLYTQLSLTGNVGLNGSYNHYPDSDLFLSDLASPHNNHARDPGTSTINLTQSATTHWNRARALPDPLALTQYVHIHLLGWGGSGGDPDLSKHSAVFDVTMVPGQPVRVTGDDTVNTANAATPTGAEAIGVVLTGATTGNTGVYLTNGNVTNLDWTAVAGSANLTPGSIYYLSDSTAGMITDTAPVTSGSSIVRIGTALSTTKLGLEIGLVILI